MGLVAHRILWVLILALSVRKPGICKFFFSYETLAVMLDGARSFSGIKDRYTGDFILLYLFLMSTAAFIGLSFGKRDIVISAA